MANSLKQSFLNTLFQWTVKTTAAEPKPPSPPPPTTTADSLQPMSDDVTIPLIFKHNISMNKLFFRVKNGCIVL